MPFRFQRTAPMIVSPHDPDVIYHGSHVLHRTRDQGATWETISEDLTENDPEFQGYSGGPITRDITGEEIYSTIYAIAESYQEAGSRSGSVPTTVRCTSRGTAARAGAEVTPKEPTARWSRQPDRRLAAPGGHRLRHRSTAFSSTIGSPTSIAPTTTAARWTRLTNGSQRHSCGHAGARRAGGSRGRRPALRRARSSGSVRLGRRR